MYYYYYLITCSGLYLWFRIPGVYVLFDSVCVCETSPLACQERRSLPYKKPESAPRQF